MSDAAEEKLFNVRLTPEDRELLGAVAKHLNRDKSATIRLLIRRAALSYLPMNSAGCFTSLPTINCPQSVQFPIRIRGASDE